MADVTITYKGANIATMDATGSKTLQTAGTYCEGDIGVEYVKPGGGVPVAESKDVDFIDYDGTIRYSYTAAEFAALTAMPANPDHSDDAVPLTAQGWNWSLEDAQAYVAEYGYLSIGQMYITTDGKTHIKIHIAPESPSNRMMVNLYFAQTVAYGVTVNWGDNNIDNYSHTGAAGHTHRYAQGGDYDITLTVTDGTISFPGTSGNSGYSIYGSRSNASSYSRGRIWEVRFGSGLDAGAFDADYAFYYCYGLTTMTIPRGITSIPSHFFYVTAALTAFVVPDTVTTIGDSAFESCQSMMGFSMPKSVTSIGASGCVAMYAMRKFSLPPNLSSISDKLLYNFRALQYIKLPSGITSIGEQAFYNQQDLIKLTIPASVTTIGANAFQYCYGVSEYHFLSEMPPTLENTNAFVSIQSNCVIYVPYSEDHSILNAYKSATNWSTRAAYMQEEPQ